MGAKYRRATKLSITFALFLVLFGKVYVSDMHDLSFLWAYGGAVTLVLWFTFMVTYLRYRDPSELAVTAKTGDRSEPLFVSCMVAVRNEERHIERCVKSILAQDYSQKEIIVVNDASTDGTSKVLEPYVQRGEIVLITFDENVGKKAALTQAMLQAKGQIFAHTDSDSIWAPDALSKIIPIFAADPAVGTVSGHGRALNAQRNLLTLAQDAWMEGQFSIRKAFESVFGSVTCVSGPLAVFRRQAVFNYLPAWAGDTFLGREFKFATDRTLTGIVLASRAMRAKLRAKFSGGDYPFEPETAAPDKWKVLYCQAAKSWTIVPDTFAKFLRQQVRWKKSFIRNSFFTGAFFWKRAAPVAAVYYAHIIFVIMGPFVSFRHLIYLPAQGDPFAAVLYLAGILLIGLLFGIACKVEDSPSHHWIYRPIMSLMSTLVISWLIFYSAITIRKMTWHRG